MPSSGYPSSMLIIGIPRMVDIIWLPRVMILFYVPKPPLTRQPHQEMPWHAKVLARLYLLTGRAEYRERAEAVLAAFAGSAATRPTEHCALFNARAWLENPLQIISHWIKNRSNCKNFFTTPSGNGSLPTAMILYPATSSGNKLPPNHPASGKTALNGQATAYVCHGPVCGPPITTENGLLTALDAGEPLNWS